MTEQQKRKLLTGLKKVKEGILGSTNTDISYADNLQVNEDEFTSKIPNERNVIAKKFETKADFNSYVNQRRGLEITAKEFDSVTNYKEAKPVQADRYFIKYETTDEFGNNDTTVIKKLKEDGKLCWTAFSKYQSSSEEGNPQGESGEDSVVDDTIRITKTVTFIDEIDGANALADLLLTLNI